jgi:hypothetical protein
VARAADGEPLLLGRTNEATRTTELKGGGLDVTTVGIGGGPAITGGDFIVGHNGPGVYGRAFGNQGVKGESARGVGVSGLGPTGVLGFGGMALQTIRSIGVVGVSQGRRGLVAPGGQPINDLAGAFDGDVQVNGELGVSVPAPDGSRRLLHPVLGAEAWLENVGTGTLRNGDAVVKLDPDFTALIGTADYCVVVQALGRARALCPSSGP